MSFSFSAASVKDDYNLIDQKKKISHNKTSKYYPAIDTQKVNDVLQSIHERKEDSDLEQNALGDYFDTPPPSSVSMGSQRTIGKENMQNANSFSPNPLPSSNESLDMHQMHHNYQDDQSVNEYYKKYIPNFTPQQLQMQPPYPYSSTNQNKPVSNPQDVLVQKMNYMIHLMEEKKDEKTNTATEEIILYSFLGIFIIFVVDSFTKVGKYTR